MRWVIAACVLAGGCEALFPLDAPDDATPTGCVLMCPGYQPIGNSFYRRSSTADAFGDLTSGAEHQCVSDQPGGAFTHLAVIDGNIELGTIIANFAGVLWLGHRRTVGDGAFLPVTSEPTSFPPTSPGAPWANGEPSGSPCMALVNEGPVLDRGLAARSCSDALEFVCECDCFAATR